MTPTNLRSGSSVVGDLGHQARVIQITCRVGSGSRGRSQPRIGQPRPSIEIVVDALDVDDQAVALLSDAAFVLQREQLARRRLARKAGHVADVAVHEMVFEYQVAV